MAVIIAKKVTPLWRLHLIRLIAFATFPFKAKASV